MLPLTLFEMSAPLNNDFKADCADVVIGLSLWLCRFCRCMGMMLKVGLLSFILRIQVLRHKIGLCKYGHNYAIWPPQNA